MEVDAVCVDAPISSDLVGGVCLEPGCAGDGNVGVDDYVVASPGSDIDGQPGSPLLLKSSRSNMLHCLGWM